MRLLFSPLFRPAAGLKVTFHALLHPEWKFEENDKRVYIQFESNLREISMKVQGSIPYVSDFSCCVHRAVI